MFWRNLQCVPCAICKEWSKLDACFCSLSGLTLIAYHNERGAICTHANTPTAIYNNDPRRYGACICVSSSEFNVWQDRKFIVVLESKNTINKDDIYTPHGNRAHLHFLRTNTST